jgi:hypothetical protein
MNMRTYEHLSMTGLPMMKGRRRPITEGESGTGRGPVGTLPAIHSDEAEQRQFPASFGGGHGQSVDHSDRGERPASALPPQGMSVAAASARRALESVGVERFL